VFSCLTLLVINPFAWRVVAIKIAGLLLLQCSYFSLLQNNNLQTKDQHFKPKEVMKMKGVSELSWQNAPIMVNLAPK